MKLPVLSGEKLMDVQRKLLSFQCKSRAGIFIINLPNWVQWRIKSSNKKDKPNIF